MDVKAAIRRVLNVVKVTTRFNVTQESFHADALDFTTAILDSAPVWRRSNRFIH